jgi:hypothetical protein
MADAEPTARGAFERIRAAHGPGLPRVTVEWRDLSVVGSESAPGCCKTAPVQIVQGVTAKALPGRLTLVSPPLASYSPAQCRSCFSASATSKALPEKLGATSSADLTSSLGLARRVGHKPRVIRTGEPTGRYWCAGKLPAGGALTRNVLASLLVGLAAVSRFH